MENDMLKDLFNQKRYEDVIDLLKSLFCGLYEEMLIYKNVSYDEDKSDYTTLAALVRKNYPQFLDNFSLMQATSANPDNTYLDYINVLLSTYMFFKKEYKNSSEANKYDEDIEFID